MSTLLIEGGHRLSGRVEVEGNKNAALPLLAACLLTDQECVLDQRAADRGRRGDGAAAARTSGAEVEGIGTTTLRVRCRGGHEGSSPTPRSSGRLRGSVLLLGPLLARRGRASVAPPGGDFPARRTIRTHLERARARWAPCRSTAPGHAPRGARRAEAGASLLPRRGVGHGHRDRAARRRRRQGRTEIRHAAMRAARRRAVPVPAARWGWASTARARPRIRVEGGPRLGRRRTRLDGDYIEAGSWAVVGAITGGDVDVSGRARRGHGASVAGAQPTARAMHARGRAASASSRTLRAPGAITTGLWPGFPERPRQPRDRAGHAGARGARSCTTGSTSCGSSRSSR